MCHEEKGLIVQVIKIDKNTKHYKIWCYCKGCGENGTVKKGILRVSGTNFGINWSNYQLHIFTCDPDLWYRIWYANTKKKSIYDAYSMSIMHPLFFFVWYYRV